jgi:fumarylacetoacetate (FAA) hydrolase
MRLVSFSAAPAAAPALGALEGERILDLAAAASIVGSGTDRPELQSLDALLADWERGRALVAEVLSRVAVAQGAAGRALEAAHRDLEAATIRPPVSRPPTVRDFYAFEAHVKNARARRGLEVPHEWYEFPAFYFSNPGSLVGHRAAVRRPSWTAALDYELEIACIIGRRARNVSATDWESVVAGFTILNDWSARDVQRREMAIGLGPAKGKDFATSLGPALVTLDELGPARTGERLSLAMEARVNGVVLSRGNVCDLRYSFGQMIARASQDVYLLPGDVIGSGTVGSGCLLELGPEVHRWLEPGDEVSLEIERLGTLTNAIV